MQNDILLTDIDYTSFGGWSISEELFNWILTNLPYGSTIVELGSGRATKELVKRYKVYSIEHDVNWLNLVPESTYIFAPIINGWYDYSSIKNNLPKKYDLIIIDGPIKKDRINFINNYKLFNTEIPIIIDDTNRNADKEMSISLSNILKKEMVEIIGKEKNFIILK